MFEHTRWYKLAEQYYDADTFAHAKRVAGYAYANPATNSWESIDLDILYQTALFHDILEDTDFEFYSPKNRYLFWTDAIDAVKILTKEKNETYVEYCRRIRDSGNQIAYIVKLADMKDHLSLKETLTPRLKEKYLSGLAELL